MALALSGQALAADCPQYVGHDYVLGGAPGTNGVNPWDCSSCMNWILGHDFGLRLPGQSQAGFDGSSHGPGSWQYISWNGARTVGSADVGRLIIWPGMGAAGHIGMCISKTKMFSALNPAMGTQITDIVTTKPGFHIFREITDAGNPNLAGCLPGLLIAMIAKETLNARMANHRYRATHHSGASRVRRIGGKRQIEL